MPFHKLSQWLAYSLFEPFEWAGATVTGRDDLTALPEYRNGGLLLDTGVLALRDDADAVVAHDVGSELVVEWRALTVALLDELAPVVRDDSAARRTCRSPASSRAARGPPGANSRASCAAATRRCTIRSDGTVF